MEQLGPLTQEPIVAFWNLFQPFIIAAVGSAFGAIGGAWGAQKIIERNKIRGELLTEVRNTNAAIMVCFTTCNSALALKKQHVKSLVEDYNKNKELFFHGQKNSTAEITHLNFDFRDITLPIDPISNLQEIIFNKISCQGRALSLVQKIDESLKNLQNSILKRMHLVEQFKHMPENTIIYYYFGIELPTGSVNSEYPDTVESIELLLNCLIFFSELLIKDLKSHGDKLKEKFNKLFGDESLTITDVDFSEARQSGLMPSDEDFADWLKGFKSPES